MMKRILFLCLVAFCATGIHAQNEQDIDYSCFCVLDEMSGSLPPGYSVEYATDEHEDTHVNILFNGNVKQILNIGFVPLAVEGDKEDVLHVVDFNFDGHPDILLGNDMPRRAMALLLYSPKKKKYVFQKDYWVQHPLFNTCRKTVYCMGNDNVAQCIITKVVPKGEGLKKVEHLRITKDMELFNENSDPEFRVAHPFEFLSPAEKVLKGFDTEEELPIEWQGVVEIF